MDDKGSHHKYDWLAIRRDHAKGLSISAIARKYKVRRQTVQDRKVAEGWADKIGQVAGQVAEQTVRETEEAVRPQKIAQAECVERLKTATMTAMLSTLDAFNAGTIKPAGPFSHGDVYDKVISGTARGVGLLKSLDGLAPTVPLYNDEDADDNTFRMFVDEEKAEAHAAKQAEQGTPA